MAQAHRLSPRYPFFMQGWDALNRGTADGVAPLREAARKYPDDPGAWFLLAETYIHVGGATYATDDDIRHAPDKDRPEWVGAIRLRTDLAVTKNRASCHVPIPT